MYENMLEIYKRNPPMYAMSVSYLLDKGFTYVKQIKDEDIEGLEGNWLMTQEFVQDLVRTARDIANECGNNVTEVIQFCMAEQIYSTEFYMPGGDDDYEDED